MTFWGTWAQCFGFQVTLDGHYLSQCTVTFGQKKLDKSLQPVILVAEWEHIQDKAQKIKISVSPVFMSVQFYLTLLLLPPPSPVGFQDIINIHRAAPSVA